MIPYRLCCGKQHESVECPDGLVMCCLCFMRVTQDKLHVTLDGKRENVCQACHEAEQEFIKRIGIDKS